MQPRRFFIINPNAGANRARDRWAAFKKLFGKDGAECAFTNGPGHATLLASQAAADYDVLVAAGGDGTAAEVTEGILKAEPTRAALGLLPLGTGNDLAQVLQIRNQADALASLGSGRTRNIDVLEIHCQSDGKPIVRFAMLFAGVGIISDALRKTTPALKRIFGQRKAYPAGLVRALWSYRSPEMSVTCDELSLHQRFLFAGASNTAIAGGGMKIAPDASIEDGLLNVNLIEAVGRFHALLQLNRLCHGTHTHHPKIRYHTAQRLEIHSPAGLDVAADGDLLGQTPVQISIRPKAIRVLVP